MKFSVLKTELNVSPFFFAVLTLFFLYDKNGIALPAVLISVLHETGHFLALLCVKSRPKSINLSVFGIEMELFENLSTAKKCFVLASGFFVNFIVAAFCFFIDRDLFGYISFFIGVFTALPLAATDGGAILKTIADDFSGRTSDMIFKILSVSFAVTAVILLFWIAICYKNYYLFAAIIYIIICAIK